jgi:antitoxin PrlF
MPSHLPTTFARGLRLSYSRKTRGVDSESNTCDSNTMKLTTKGQVTIPVRIRDYLGIAPHAEVDFRIIDGAVVLLKHEDPPERQNRFSTLRGVLKGRRTTEEWMRATRGE